MAREPRKFVWLEMKFRTANDLYRSRSVMVEERLSALDPGGQAAEVRAVADKVQPNPAWRLVAYEFIGNGRGLVEL